MITGQSGYGRQPLTRICFAAGKFLRAICAAAIFPLAFFAVLFLLPVLVPALYEPFCFFLGGDVGRRTFLSLGGGQFVLSAAAFGILRSISWQDGGPGRYEHWEHLAHFIDESEEVEEDEWKGK